MSENQADVWEWRLLTVIVNEGLGSKVLRLGRQAGITGGTILLGRGTVYSRRPNWTEDSGIRKEIVLMVARQTDVLNAIDKMRSQLKLGKPFRGIAFSIRICSLLGSSVCRIGSMTVREESDMVSEKVIFAIIDKGMAETVVDAAEKAGAHGATIVNARGAGIHETSRLFSMPIEPEREIVLIIDDSTRMPAIIEAVRKVANLDEPGRGILFAVDVEQAVGLFKG